MNFEDASILELINKSGDSVLCQHVLSTLQGWLDRDGIPLTDVQWIGLTSHVSAMVERSVSGNKIPSFDVMIFSEVSQESIELAEQVCELLPNLDSDEKYLLSIHFESAKQSNNE